MTLFLLVIGLFALGFALRLYDLTDLPLDFHPTRQLFSALKARGMYYQNLPDVPEWQREMAVRQWKAKVTVEPPILEAIVAATYRFIGEHLWVARLYSSLFWLVGGIFLFLLARALFSPSNALAALAFYLFLPYGVLASRSFQPDPLMVMLIITFWWAVYRWGESPVWRGALLAGLLGGAAILVKLTAAFFVVGGALGVVWGRYRLRDWVRMPQVWAMAALGALPGGAYVVYGVFVAGFLGQQFGGRLIPSLWLSPAYYLGWARQIGLVTGHLLFALALSALAFLAARRRTFLLGLWGGYFLYGVIFNYHISTHDYYSLPLIPIVALSLAPLATAWTERLQSASPLWRALALLAALYALTMTAWDVRTELKSVDYRPEATRWAEIGDLLGHRGGVVALTEDYGSRLAYWGWQSATYWPTCGDLQYFALRGASDGFERRFEELTRGKSFFLVTKMDELDCQPELRQRLETYPLYAEGDSYLILDLRPPDR